MTEREALNWEPIREFWRNNSGVNWDELEAAIKEALAQTEQEPCRHRIADIRNEAIKSGYMCMDCGALFGAYTTPPQRTWVGLTADELNMIGDRMRTWNSHSLTDVYVAIEAKLKEKNGC